MSETPEYQIDKKQEFEKLRAPEELLSFMEQNVSYGFVSKNKKIYAHDDVKMDADFQTEYSLQSPEELLESGYGVCWDTVELERRWFTEAWLQPGNIFHDVCKGGWHRLTDTYICYL